MRIGMCVVLLLVVACASGEPRVIETTPGPATTTTEVSPPPIEADCGPEPQMIPPPAGVRLTLQLNRPTYTPGQPVRMTLRVRNDLEQPVPHQERDGQDAQFLVYRGEGLIWRSTYLRSVAEPATPGDLAPGEERAFEAVWEQTVCDPAGTAEAPFAGGPMPEGRYTARALVADPGGNWRSGDVAVDITD